MIIGLGIDAVEINRFFLWQHKTPKQLSRIFSPEEILYCCAIPEKSAERFAVRFAAREALLKALTNCGFRVSLLQVSRASKVIKGLAPELFVDWAALGIEKGDFKTHLSLSHTKTAGYAVVIIEMK